MPTLLESVNTAITKIILGQVQETEVVMPGGQKMRVTALDLDKLRMLRRELYAEDDTDNGYDTVLGVFSMPETD